MIRFGRICQLCDNDFLAGSRYTQFCPECRHDRHKLIMKKASWRTMPVMGSETCLHCGESLRGRLSFTRFCDTRCRDKWRYHNTDRRERYLEQARQRRRDNGIPERQPAVPKLKRITLRHCKECGEPFEWTLSSRAYCPAHSNSDAARNSRRQPLTMQDCPECGAMFQQTVPRQKFCTVEHATRHQRRAMKRRRKAAKLAIAQESYTLIEIAARDHHRCGLCGKRVAMKQTVPHPRAPTIDHILPSSEGGDDTKANVQLAHFECNWQKAERVHPTDQLRLVG